MTKINRLRFFAAASAVAVAASVLVLLTALQPVQAAFPGTNGKIVFERDPDGYFGPEDPEIYSINFSGENLERLTNNTTRDTNPAWSADGKKIVYSAGGRRNSYGADLFVMKGDGSNKTRITREDEIRGAAKANDLDPAFSPNGRSIAFVRNGPLPEGYDSNNDIYKIGVDGKGLTRLVDIPSVEYSSGGEPAWSPDGSRIAYFSGVEEAYSIETVKPDGTGRKYVTTGYAPNWSPDGGKMTFHRSPDGGDSAIYTADADGTDEEPLTGNGTDFDADPAYAPGGGRIVFSSNRDGDYDLYIMDADGTDVRQLTNLRGADVAPDWRPVQ